MILLLLLLLCFFMMCRTCSRLRWVLCCCCCCCCCYSSLCLRSCLVRLLPILPLPGGSTTSETLEHGSTKFVLCLCLWLFRSDNNLLCAILILGQRCNGSFKSTTSETLEHGSTKFCLRLRLRLCLRQLRGGSNR